MIFRGWLAIIVIVLAVSLYLIVGMTPPDYQSPPGLDSVKRYRTENILPAVDAMVFSDQIGHEIFDIPREDADRQAKLVGDSPKKHSMPMDGSEMQMTTMDSMDDTEMQMITMDSMDHTEMQMTTMDSMETNESSRRQAGEEEMESMDSAGNNGHSEETETTASAEHNEKTQQDNGHASEELHAGAEGMDEHSASVTANIVGDHGGGRSTGMTVLAQGTPEEVARALQNIKIDRSVTIAMKEWSYDPMSINLGIGEVVRLQIRHVGSVPHEFMLMDAIGMDVVDYRLERADWNLLEHEAIFELPIVMPGDSFELVIKADEPGMFMYMCMFPKHMQFGMMGMMMAGEIMM